MSSSLLNSIETLTGATNYVKWAGQARAYLEATGLWVVMEFAPSNNAVHSHSLDVSGLQPGSGISLATTEQATATPTPPEGTQNAAVQATAAQEPEEFRAANVKARGSLKMTVSSDIRALLEQYQYARDMWLALAIKYQPKGSTNAFGHFRTAIDVQLPGTAHPSKALDKYDLAFKNLSDLGITVPEFIKAMILVTKFPAYADTVTQILTAGDEITSITLDHVKDSLLHAWTLKCGAGKKSSNGGEAHKLSAVKCNQGGKLFNQQQGGSRQQQQIQQYGQGQQ